MFKIGNNQVIMADYDSNDICNNDKSPGNSGS